MPPLKLNSPAGDWDSLRAAVYNGANSVYLGVQFFNARRLAQNFKLEELRDVVTFAHLHNVRIYLTMNTLVRNEELLMWFRTLEQAYLAGIDAVIIQEISLAPIIKKHFPGLRVHASTQASLMNYQGINLFKDLDLVVLARELTADEIKLIRKNTKTELEVFVHGHLCISYSGQCLISSLIGKRSGNRGICASSCRKRYNNEGYLISAKDLLLADSIDKIYRLGINAVKIEGRMKSPEYVGITTKTYRKQIDAAARNSFRRLTSEQIDNIKIEFNRDFTSGFFENNKAIIGADMPMNRGIPLGFIRNGKLQLTQNLSRFDGVGYWHPRQKGKFSGGFAEKILLDGQAVDFAPQGSLVVLLSPHFVNGTRVFLTSRNHGKAVLAESHDHQFDVQIVAKVGQPLQIISPYGTAYSEISLPKAKNQRLTLEQLNAELGKSSRLEIKWKVSSHELEEVFLPKRFLHNIREQLEELVRQKYLPQRQAFPLTLPEMPPATSLPPSPRLLAKVYLLEQVKEADAAGVYAIYYDIFRPDVLEAKRLCQHSKFFLDTPVVMTDADIVKMQEIINKVNPDGITIGNWGALALQFSGEKQGKLSLNVFNDITAQFLRERGVLPLLSVELNATQALKFQNKNYIYYAQGHVPVMHFKGIFPQRALTDEKEYTFPLRIVNGNTEMLYSRPIALFEKIKELPGIPFFFLDLRKDTTTIIRAYQNILNNVPQDISFQKKGTTMGNFMKGVA